MAAAVLVLGRRLRSAVALYRAPAGAFAPTGVALVAAYGVTAAVHTFLTPLTGAWSDVVAPLGEELLFRGALFTWLRQHLGAPATIAVTAMAFSGIHMYPPLLPLGFATGIVFGWIRERSHSIAPTIVAHAAHNVLMVAYAHATAGWAARLPVWGAS